MLQQSTLFLRFLNTNENCFYYMFLFFFIIFVCIQIFAVLTACWKMSMQEMNAIGAKVTLLLDFVQQMLITFKTHGDWEANPDRMQSLQFW